MKIFVSYSRRDAGDFADQIQRHLSSFKYDIFTDVKSIQAGEIWSNTITTNISNCDIFVVIVTHGALYSPHVEGEVLQAQKENKKIIPCFFRGINPNKIKWGLENIQGVEFTNEYQLARDLYSKIDIETDTSKGKGTEEVIGSTSKTMPYVKISETTPTKSSVDKIEQKNYTISASPKVIKDDIQSKSSQNIASAATTKKEEKEKRKYTERDSIDKPSQDIFGSVSKSIEERKNQSSAVRTGSIGSGIPSLSSKPTEETKTTTPTSTKSDTEKPQQKKDTDIYTSSEVQIPKSSSGLKIILPIIGVIAAILLIVIVFVNPFVPYTPSTDFTTTISNNQTNDIATKPPPSNSPPTASDKSVTTSEETPIDIALEATDKDSNRDKLTTTIISYPSNGTLSNLDPNSNKVTYTPKQDFIGTDTFEYRVDDGTADSNNAIVTVIVSGPTNIYPIGILNIVEGASIMGNPNYQPNDLTVEQGNIITINNLDSTFHTVSQGNPNNGNSPVAFDSGIILSGKSYKLDTSKISLGSFEYYCVYHPYMTGKLTIK